MLNLRAEDSLHKSHLNRLLMEIADRSILAQRLAFKGGSCASMLGYLDRFSVDLDFDVLGGADEDPLRQALLGVFDFLNLEVTSGYKDILFFQLRYPSSPGKRNSIKVSANSFPAKANRYNVQYFSEIDRLINSQTLETMVANKLVAVTDRYKLHHTIAGRDIYDIHYFLVHGYGYLPSVITERTGLTAKEYLEGLHTFIKNHVTQTMINEDLNTLLPPRQFQQVRKIILPETIALILQLSSQV